MDSQAWALLGIAVLTPVVVLLGYFYVRHALGYYDAPTG